MKQKLMGISGLQTNGLVTDSFGTYGRLDLDSLETIQSSTIMWTKYSSSYGNL